MAIERAIVSVFDKTGIVEFAKGLQKLSVEILSTGGTLKELTANKIKVTSIEDYTGSPEVMEGRVKTLHPKVHGGILARLPRDRMELNKLQAKPISLVVINLYPFEDTVKSKASHKSILEKIDIGGPCMIRAAAKNYERVTVVCDPTDYSWVLDEMNSRNGIVPLSMRKDLAKKAFAKTSSYDEAIYSYLNTTSLY